MPTTGVVGRKSQASSHRIRRLVNFVRDAPRLDPVLGKRKIFAPPFSDESASSTSQREMDRSRLSLITAAG
jgi:hypothetical protein